MRGRLYLRMPEPLPDAVLADLRTRFMADLGLSPDDDLMAPWVPLVLAAYPECLPGPMAHWYEANLAHAYYGPGYERGYLPLFVRCAEWLEATALGGTVWYGDDVSDESVCPFGPAAREELRAYFERVGHAPYDSKARRP